MCGSLHQKSFSFKLCYNNNFIIAINLSQDRCDYCRASRPFKLHQAISFEDINSFVIINSNVLV